MKTNGATRLDDIMAQAFSDGLCNFQETVTIILALHQIGSLEPISHLEDARQRLIAQKDGSVDDQSAFRDLYDWRSVRVKLLLFADSIAPKAGPDESPKSMAQELECMARWLRLQEKEWQDDGWQERVEPHITP